MWIINSKYDEPDFYRSLENELVALIEGETNLVANLANISSWIYHSMPDLNWCGFYLWEEAKQELVLGPFQGMPACLRIAPQRGVCGAAFTQKKTMLVDDVHEFPGHIACDSTTRSELVIPLMKNGIVNGVLDLDSPKTARFTERDAIGLEVIIQRLSIKLLQA